MNNRTSDKKQWKPAKKEIILYSFLGILFIGQVVFCFIFYNWANLDFVLYLGWATFAFSMVIGMMPYRAFQEKGKAPAGENWLHTTAIVDSGIYAIIRHPMYLSGILLILSLILISQHWLSLIFGITTIVYFYLGMLQEEKSNIEKFGDAYIAYMTRVPRMNLILGIIRSCRKKKGSRDS